MDNQNLKAFITVANSWFLLRVRRTAAYLTQSAISKRIAQLEASDR